jgi:hypothetical protein
MGFTRRTKMISLRLSEHEFEQLKATSEAQGARSVSDYARVALCGFSSKPDGNLEADVQKLSGDLRQLNHDVRRLTELLEGPRQAFTSPPSRDPNQKADFRNA